MARRKRRGRPIDGILLLDKPQGAGSNTVLQRVKHLYRAAKAGHTGSLDPLATGLLPICFGEATKFSRYMLDADKAYETTVCLGASSDTGDLDGQLQRQCDASELDSTAIESTVASFLGEQMQKPPIYSALKHKGERLYDLARQGIEVDVPERPITVHQIGLRAIRLGEHCQLEMQQGSALHSAEIDIDMRVSKGTYVRSIARDIGEMLGVGAFVGALRRTGVAPFSLQRSVELAQIENIVQSAHSEQAADESLFAELDAKLVPIDEALSHLPLVTLDDDSGFYLSRGNPVQVSGAPLNGQVRIALGSGRFLGIGEIDDNGRVAPRRLVAG
ncbi:MAG: tRNA pseudouridine(55) synthase TruB [Pseudomonadales bacterium]|nr:tRNA pseudouridine(55) synthase TruB [Pseudomonadales bacterium]